MSKATVSLVGEDEEVRKKAVDIESLTKEDKEYEVLTNEELEKRFIE